MPKSRSRVISLES